MVCSKASSPCGEQFSPLGTRGAMDTVSLGVILLSGPGSGATHPPDPSVTAGGCSLGLNSPGTPSLQ